MSKSDQTAPTAGNVIEKLKAYKKTREGDAMFTLPETGIAVTYPAFRSHGKWQRCMRRNKGDVAKAQIDYITTIATFDGQRITVADWEEYVPMADANALLAAVFVGDEDEDEAGDAAGELH